MRIVAPLAPQLPSRVWYFNLALLAGAVGTGLILPFELLYLHGARGFSFGVAGAVVAVAAAVAPAGGLAVGAAADRFTSRSLAAFAALVSAVGYTGFAFATVPWQAIAANLLVGLGVGGTMPMQAAVIAALTRPEERDAAYGLELAVGNLGIAAGAAGAGFVARAGDVDTFTRIWLAAAGCALVYAVLAYRLGRAERPHAGGDVSECPGRIRYRDLVSRPDVLIFLGTTLAFVVGGAVAFQVALPPYVSAHGVSTHVIGLTYLVDSLTIVLLQLPIARALSGRPRLPSVAVALLTWASAWVALAVAMATVSDRHAPAVLLPAAVAIGAATAVAAPLLAAQASELVGEEAQPRVLALFWNTYAVGFALGPLASGVLLGAARQALLPAAAAVVAAGAAGALALNARIRAEPSRPPRTGRAAHVARL